MGCFLGGSGGALRAVQGKTAASRAVVYGGNCGGGESGPPTTTSLPSNVCSLAHMFDPAAPRPSVPRTLRPVVTWPKSSRHGTTLRRSPPAPPWLRPGHKESASAEDLILRLCHARLLSISTHYPSGGRGVAVARVWGGWYDEFIVPTGEPGRRYCCTRS